jgi:hypothetical protein
VADRGLSVVRPGDEAGDDRTAEPVAVVMGFGPEVGWRDLARAAHAVNAGARFVATNRDRTVPTPDGPAPGNGMLVAAVAAASRAPDAVLGKPEPGLFLAGQARTGAHRPLVIGDRLDTDIAGAERAGLASLLVLTGVTSARELVLAPPGQRPTHVGRDLRALHAAIPLPARQREGTRLWSAGEFAADLSSTGVVEVRRATHVPAEAAGAGDGLDPLRAACACAWSAEPGRVVDVTGPLDVGAE